MEHAARGAKGAGGITVGLLPGDEPSTANPYIDVAIATGLGQARNAVLVLSADGVIAVGGGLGTLSEIALALQRGRPAIGIRTWRFDRDGQVETTLPVALSAAEGLDWLFERIG
jgi:uncharacterized protein (TIGR00725 family)